MAASLLFNYLFYCGKKKKSKFSVNFFTCVGYFLPSFLTHFNENFTCYLKVSLINFFFRLHHKAINERPTETLLIRCVVDLAKKSFLFACGTLNLLS